MRHFTRTHIIILAVVIVTALVVWFVLGRSTEEPIASQTESHSLQHITVGKSVERRDIEAYSYMPTLASEGTSKHILFVGGIHGGYEWNSVLLAYEFIDYLKDHLDLIPSDVAVSIIPSANPDGVHSVVGKEGRFTQADIPSEGSQEHGRFNANDVDLNRNFDCKWQKESTWRGDVVSAGTKPFSEPEAAALRDFVEANNIDAVVFWHSQANAVYASECEDGILAETLALMDAYSQASGYPAVESFDSYSITGDAEGWLASIGIPAVTVELATHETIEWEQNLAGVRALLSKYTDER